MRLKRTLLAVTTVFSALLGLNGCGSDSGSSVYQRNVEGVWSFYEADDSYLPTAPESNPVPSSPPVYGVSNALAYGGSIENRPIKNGFTKNLVLQLTNEGEVNQICSTCGQAAGGRRLYGKFISINHRLLCTPDLNSTQNNKPIPPNTWLRLYGTLEGTQIEAKLTGNINKRNCSRDTNEGTPPGPNNCAPEASGTDGVTTAGSPTFTSQTADFKESYVGRFITIEFVLEPTCPGCPPVYPPPLITTIKAINSGTSLELEDPPDYSVTQAKWAIGPTFPATFQHPVEVDVSGELQWEFWQETIFGNLGFCKMVLSYDKLIHPDETTGVEPPVACNAEEQRTGEFELYKSGYRPTDTSSVNCATSVPPFWWVKLIKNYAEWSSSPTPPPPPAVGGCDTRDAYRWGPILMPESECLDTYVSE